MATASRAQHVVPGAVVLGVALLVAWLSFTQEPADAFLFPRVVSVAFVVLAVWNFARAAMGLARVGGGVDRATAMAVLPGLVVMGVFVFFAAKALGFYVSSTLAFLTLYTLYDPAPLSSARDWGKRVLVTAVFMAVIYALFAMLLQVQTPRGAFI